MGYKNILLMFAFNYLICGCSFLMIGKHSGPNSYKYYSKRYQLLPNSPLKTDGFYYSKYKSKKDEYDSYLRFYNDGRVNYKITTGKPENDKESYWPFNDVYGFYKSQDDKIFFELKSNYGTYRHAQGRIISDTLKLRIFDKRSNGDTTYYADYVFHKGFAN
jgi:hypothetical protein